MTDSEYYGTFEKGEQELSEAAKENIRGLVTDALDAGINDINNNGAV